MISEEQREKIFEKLDEIRFRNKKIKKLDSIIFEISDEKELETLSKWFATHKCKFRDDPSAAGAIGGSISYRFTPTGVGTCIEVSCSCGAKIDITNIDNW